MSEQKKRVIVITGASAGVGRAIAQEFAKKGESLGLIARGMEKLESTVKEVQELGGKAIAISADVSNEIELENAALEIEKVLGPIDIWINNAMVTMIGGVNEISSSEIKRVMDVNYMGSVNGILVANRRFLPQNRGHIIQIGSALAYLSIPLQSAYCASKHAIHGFIQSFRIELRANQQKVKVSEVHLPAVNTPQFEWMKNHTNKHPMPVPPIFQPELMAKAVAYIADHPRKEFWVCWPAVKAILGEKLAPWLAEWKLAKEGIESQQTESAPVTNIDNMWKPINRDYGARGIFSKVAKDRSVLLWMDMHRLYVLYFAIITFAVYFLFIVNKQ
ncbi:MAG: SDR family oxidoreductase [Bacteriovoracaceae bacterium]|nr:SDR family oxidoreductase [Bacteriovoracaceae bacterium]